MVFALFGRFRVIVAMAPFFVYFTISSVVLCPSSDILSVSLPIGKFFHLDLPTGKGQS
jgi:hypothetical protein